MFQRVTFRVLVVLLIAFAGCTVQQSDTPRLTGPSELGTSVTVTATPDRLNMGNSSNAAGDSSVITVKVFDASGNPLPNVGVRLDIVVGSNIQDCGDLTAHNLVTGSNGTATAIFTAPGNPPVPAARCAGFTPGNTISIQATPVGTNFQTAVAHSVNIIMTPAGVILPPPDTPTAQFTFSPSNPSANSQVNFDGTSSCAGPLNPGGIGCATTSGTITSYSWNFGDGAVKTGALTSHDFAAAQTYNVTLTVTNDRGRSASVTHSVGVGAGTAPSGDWVFSPAAPVVGSAVVFNAAGVKAGPGRAIVSYAWDFGDGFTGSGSSVSHTFTAAGTYSVVLTVTDDVNQSTVITKSVPIGSGNPTAVLSVTKTGGLSILADGSTSSATGSSTIVTYTFFFGDGTSTSGAASSAAHTYLAAGTYSVTLRVTDSLGRVGTSAPQTVTVP